MEKDKYHIICLYAESKKKNDTNKLIYKTETLRLGEQTYDYQGERGEERKIGNLGLMWTLYYIQNK